MTENCLFCRVVSGEVPADVVLETDRVVAFRDINPQAPTHVLLIPKEHIGSIRDVSDSEGSLLAEISQTAARIAKTDGIDESGWRVVSNVGPDAGQSVFHLHFHLLGGRPMSWPPG